VSYYKYLRPIVNFQIRRVGPIQTDGDDAGKPDYFDQEVQTQLTRMGAPGITKRARRENPIRGTMGAPRPAQESMEAQIDRIDQLLQEVDPSYDLRIYSIKIGCVIDRDQGGTESETATEIRGIEAITTVRPIAASKRPVTATSEYVMYDIKFELLGARSRVEFRDEILLPRLRQIKGLKIMTVSSIHRTNRKGTIRTVREAVNEYGGISNFGGRASNLGALRNTYQNKMQTPRSDIKTVLDDWVEGSVQLYDMPTDTSNMAYHVMVPVEELLPYTDRIHRAPKDIFDGNYENFIKTGPLSPVYLALGKNGRVKITGGQDLVWFAKKSGLKELPVFFSYQRQV